MSNAVFKIIFFLAVIALVGGCSGADPGEPSIKTGRFVDSPVSNLAYRTESQSGFTNSDGEFQYIVGETIVFSVGSLEFPSARAGGLVTPQSLANVPVESIGDTVVTNIARLLQSLDSDTDRTTIEIREDAHSSTLKVTESDSLSFFEDPDFDNNVAELVPDLISADEAQEHLRESFELPANQLPIADAGSVQSVTVGDTVTLDGTGSSDPDGDPANLIYQWSLVSPDGANAVLSNATASKAFFIPNAAGSYTASLVVNDGQDSSPASSVTISASATVNIQVEVLPTVYNVTLDFTSTTTSSDGSLTGGVTTNVEGTGTIDTETGIVTSTGTEITSNQTFFGNPTVGDISLDIYIDSAAETGTQTRTSCVDVQATLTCSGTSSPSLNEALPLDGLTGNNWEGGETTGDILTYGIDATQPNPITGGDIYNQGALTVTLGQPVTE